MTSQTILIADDEPLARQTLRAYLGDLGCTGAVYEAADGPSAIAIANQQRPDLIFLDIVMPGATGIQVLEQLRHDAVVIFTTAHDRYAVTAFELGALDYVLKPFGRDRLRRVIERATAASAGPATSILSRARDTLAPVRPLSKIFVRDADRIVPVPVAAIERVQGADDYVTIVTAIKEYLVSIRLSELEAELAPASFLRIHRSHLVNLEYVTSIERCDPSRMLVMMKSGARIAASRAGSKRLRELALSSRTSPSR
jgi:two-component system LytT family response regulator